MARPFFRISGFAFFITAGISACVAFGFGVFLSGRQLIVAQHVVEQAPISRALIEENQRLKKELQRVASSLEVVKDDNARLVTASLDLAAVETDGLIGAPPARHVIQKSVLDNLKKVVAARDRFQIEHGRVPFSIEEIVGRDAYIKRLVPVDREDYTSLSLWEGTALVVTTGSGVTVKYGVGANADATTEIEYPPATARFRELKAAVGPSLRSALEAYRLANRGKDPEDNRLLLPFFATAQEGAAFLKTIEALKAAEVP